jgi:uncharacterized membrane protein
MVRKPRKTSPNPAKRHPWIVRFLHFHIRLVVAIALGVVAYLLLPQGWSRVTRMLVGWDVGMVSYLGAVAVMMLRTTDHAPQQRAATQEDEGAVAILVLTVLAAAVSLGAIFAELAQIQSADPTYGYHIALAVGTVVLSWAFTHTIFALHYAYDFYGEGLRAKGLKFPDDDKPDYWDFIYFAFVIGMTFQVSDVQVTNKGIRRLVTAHGMVSFLFNTTLIALTVNMATDLF